MIGDKDLDIQRETNSTPWLSDLVKQAAHKFGYDKYFFQSEEPVEDGVVVGHFMHAARVACFSRCTSWGLSWTQAFLSPQHHHPIRRAHARASRQHEERIDFNEKRFERKELARNVVTGFSQGRV